MLFTLDFPFPSLAWNGQGREFWLLFLSWSFYATSDSSGGMEKTWGEEKSLNDWHNFHMSLIPSVEAGPKSVFLFVFFFLWGTCNFFREFPNGDFHLLFLKLWYFPIVEVSLTVSLTILLPAFFCLGHYIPSEGHLGQSSFQEFSVNSLMWHPHLIYKKYDQSFAITRNGPHV